MNITLSDPIIFRRRCDASGGIALNAERWVGANDENNALQLYSVKSEEPVAEEFVDLGAFLELTGEEDELEADLESATRMGDLIYWIGSHSQSKKNKNRPNRRRLFATRIVGQGKNVQLEPVGAPCKTLRDTLVNELDATFKLEKATKIPPKEKGGFNIESLCADPNGSLLWVGFRNPIPAEGALLVPVTNPAEVAEGHDATLGEPELVDMGGLGFRDMIWTGGRYLILAGDFLSPPDARESRLFLWDGPGTVAQPVDLSFRDPADPETLNPEALIAFPDGRILIVSDDGTRECDGGAICKESPVEERCFRAVWLEFGVDQGET